MTRPYVPQRSVQLLGLSKIFGKWNAKTQCNQRWLKISSHASLDIINHGELYHMISDDVINFSKENLKSSMSVFVSQHFACCGHFY